MKTSQSTFCFDFGSDQIENSPKNVNVKLYDLFFLWKIKKDCFVCTVSQRSPKQNLDPSNIFFWVTQKVRFGMIWVWVNDDRISLCKSIANVRPQEKNIGDEES